MFVNIVSDNGLLPDGIKLLHDLMPTYQWDTPRTYFNEIWLKLQTLAAISMGINFKYSADLW